VVDVAGLRMSIRSVPVTTLSVADVVKQVPKSRLVAFGVVFPASRLAIAPSQRLTVRFASSMVTQLHPAWQAFLLP
jgi:hypothetical protein